MAVGLHRIDPADVPDTAKLQNSQGTTAKSNVKAPTTPGSSQKKRKAAAMASSQPTTPASSQPSSSQPRSSQALHRPSQLSTSQMLEEDDDEDVVEVEDTRDELYVMLKTSIVGVQYYNGELIHWRVFI